jgi:hypothetical protein
MHELPERKIDWDAYYDPPSEPDDDPCVACGKNVSECGCSEEQIKEAYEALYEEWRKEEK